MPSPQLNFIGANKMDFQTIFRLRNNFHNLGSNGIVYSFDETNSFLAKPTAGNHHRRKTILINGKLFASATLLQTNAKKYHRAQERRY